MKILHCADLHITCLKKMLGEDNAYDRAQKALYALSHTVWEEKPDVIVIIGDIFDDNDPDSDELFLFSQFLLPILEENIAVIIIPGNHDSLSEGGRSAIDFLRPMDEAIKNLYVALREPRVVNIRDIAFIMWPWGILPKREDKLLFSRGNGKRPKKRIGLLHTTLANSKISSDGRRVKKGFSVSMANKTLEIFNLCYLLLGDVHEYQTFGKGKIIYSGALYQTKFNESKDKGVILIDTDYRTSRFLRIEGVPKLETVTSTNKVNDFDFFKFSVGSKESALKALNRRLPENIVKVEHSLKRQKHEQLVESGSRLGLKISLIPILIKILKKQQIKDIKGAMEYLISLAESKDDLILP